MQDVGYAGLHAVPEHAAVTGQQQPQAPTAWRVLAVVTCPKRLMSRRRGWVTRLAEAEADACYQQGPHYQWSVGLSNQSDPPPFNPCCQCTCEGTDPLASLPDSSLWPVLLHVQRAVALQCTEGYPGLFTVRCPLPVCKTAVFLTAHPVRAGQNRPGNATVDSLSLGKKLY